VSGSLYRTGAVVIGRLARHVEHVPDVGRRQRVRRAAHLRAANPNPVLLVGLGFASAASAMGILRWVYCDGYTAMGRWLLSLYWQQRAAVCSDAVNSTVYSAIYRF
jgi:hypothetical protein